MLSAHFAHTREFRLRADLGTRHIDDRVEEICSLEAPAMEHFELRSISLPRPITFLKAPFFNGAPKLRTLSLSQVRVPWSFIPRGQLTQLKITLTASRFIADQPSGDSESLIDLLINCPKLEILQSIFLASHICPLVVQVHVCLPLQHFTWIVPPRIRPLITTIIYFLSSQRTSTTSPPSK
ncbi:hypothetical protein BC826DRAFT_1037023 [Russula brevipes]|nr:hypothetical protein BC826DRAFT_1037023 [Russula brevipes]